MELRLGLRRLRSDLLLTITAMVSLAIGIGANTAIYTVARSLLVRPQPGVTSPADLVDIGHTSQGNGFNTLSYPDYANLRARATTMENVYAQNLFPQAVSLAIGSAVPDRLFVTFVSDNYFAALGVTPSEGRMLQSDDGQGATAAPAVVISSALRTRLFNREAGVVGRSLMINGQATTVIGVAPRDFHGTGVRSADAWLPIGALQTRDSAALLTSGQGSWLLVGARLKPGRSVAQANAEAEVIGRTSPSRTSNPNGSLRAVAASPVPGGATQVAAFMTFLVAVLGTVLAVASANVAGMLLSRAPTRWREMAVRAALGATRGRLVRQLLVETTLLFLVSAAAGLFVARTLTRAVLGLLPAFPFPIELSLPLDTRAVAFTTLLALVAAVLAGLVPALQSARVNLTSTMNADRQGPSRMRLRRAFVVGQVALSLVLVIVGGLFVRGLLRAGAADPGFDARGIDLVTLDLSNGQPTSPIWTQTLPQAVERVTAIPGMDRVSAALAFPGGFEEFRLGDLSAPGSPEGLAGEWNVVEPRFFETIRMPLVAGRDFSPADRGGATPVVIVGEGAVRRLWPGRPITAAIGQVVEERGFDPVRRAPKIVRLTIVGVARDPAYGTLIDGATDVHVYVPFAQQPMARMMLVARTTDGRSAASEIRAAVTSLGASVTIVSTRSGEEYSSLGLMPQRLGAKVTASLGLVGVLLAAIGIYGVTAHAVTRRTREIGIRIALGAPFAAIGKLILREGMSLVLLGAVIGLVLGLGAAQVVAGYLAGLPPVDPVTFSGAVTLFAVMGLAACSVPLWRALHIAPTEALRDE